MNTIALAALGLFILAFGLVSRRVQTTPFTAPMAFVLFGLLIGTHGLGLVAVGLESPAAKGFPEEALHNENFF